MDAKIETGLAHVDDVDGFSRYTVYLERRRVLDALVNLSTTVAVPEGAVINPAFTLHPILVAMVDAPAETAQATKGFAAASYELGEDGFTLTVQTSSIGSYVGPRMAALLARLFVPPAA